MAVPFTQEAEEAIKSYLEKLDKKIIELGFEISDERKRDFLLAVNNSLKLSSIRRAKKSGRKVVEEKDAKASLKHLTPEMLIRHGLQTPKIFVRVEELRTKHFQMIKEKLASSAQPKILDAGCQYGRQLMEFLRCRWKGEFFGADIDIEALKYGKSVEPSIVFVAADIQGNLPFKDNSFDAVICIGVLHLIKNVHTTIQEFARVLKPNGVLFIIQAFVRNKILGSLAYLMWRLIPKIGRLYHVSDIEKILSRNGFTRIITDKAFLIPLAFGDVYLCTAFLSKAIGQDALRYQERTKC